MSLMELAVVCVLSLLRGVHTADWSYSGNHGPTHWKDDHPICAKDNQSPINIYEGDVQKDPTISAQAFQFQNYDTTSGLTMTLKNNGHTAVVAVDMDTPVTVRGGGLPGEFRALQFHFHWGRSYMTGSEHFINSKAYPMEVHVVHYNTKYTDVSKAIDQADGLAVLGFMFEVGTFNPNYSSIVNSLPLVNNSGASTVIPTVSLNSLLPQNFQNFYRYPGSLTTPPCQESVTWTVFKETIKISTDQLEQFRILQDSHNHQLVDNYREVQQLNTRTVTANFDPDIHWGYSTGHVDVDRWGDYYSNCAAESQSPVNIVTDDSRYDTIGNFTFNNYDATRGPEMRLKNNGHAAEIDITAGDISIAGAGLQETYRAAQFHMHWGSSDMTGSEHTLEGAAFPMEVHIVHYRESLRTLKNAASIPGGLAVLGFFFEVSATDNPALSPIIDRLIYIQNPGNNTTIPTFSLNSILPQDKHRFFRYTGSLTTPRCFETVIWTVFKDTIKISQSQLAAFRRLKSSEKDEAGVTLPMVDNFRPVQELNFRIIRNNFIPSAKQHWTYHGEHGADHWYQDFPTCEDKPTSRQSPINLQPKKVQFREIKPFSLYNYSSVANVTMLIQNNGHTAEILITGSSILISGGGLQNSYQAAQLHFHWGSDHKHGSEHLIDNVAYPMEIHIVHYNTIYPDLGTAASKSNGLAVLGFMYEVTKEHNPAYDGIVKKLSEIKTPNTIASIETMALSTLLPSDIGEFYRYDGSLTTPGCYESVTWSVFRNTIKISETQLKAFRSLLSSDIDPETSRYTALVDNYRPPMNINKRVVQANFIIISAGSSFAASLTLLLFSLVATLQRLTS